MAQNIYDDETFFAGYAKLPRSVNGLEAAPEWPTLEAMLPKMTGLSVLDLGCGFGWFCRWARDHGAARVLGVDLSEKMLARARTDTQDPTISYRREDLDLITLPVGAFDLAYSSLALHYVANFESLLAQIHRALTREGHFVFSVEHPQFTAPSTPAWTMDTAGRRSWPINDYRAEGPRRTDWLAPGVVKQHRTIASIINALVRAGFAVTQMEEWGPTAEQVASHPHWADERERPPFLLLAARRKGK